MSYDAFFHIAIVSSVPIPKDSIVKGVKGLFPLVNSKRDKRKR